MSTIKPLEVEEVLRLAAVHGNRDLYTTGRMLYDQCHLLVGLYYHEASLAVSKVGGTTRITKMNGEQRTYKEDDIDIRRVNLELDGSYLVTRAYIG